MRPYSPPSRIVVGLLMALFVAAPVACRKPAKPSEAYTQAHTRFGKLYGEKGDDVFLDPELAEVESLLAQVPADSLDAQAAQELRARIQTGKQQVAAQQKAQEDAMAKAREQGPASSNFGSDTGSSYASAPSDSEPADEDSDAGTVDADAGSGVPGVGTPEAQLASSGCFQKGEPLEVKGRGRRDRWELADRPACRQQYGALQDQVLIIEEGKVLAQVPRSALQAIPVDGGTGPTPDAGR